MQQQKNYSMLFADFATREQADRVVHDLEDMGYQSKDISVIAMEGGKVTERNADGGAAEGALGGAVTGGAIGGLAGLLASAGLIPGVAGLVVIGPIAAALGLAGVAATTVTGAVVGALTGGLVGALAKLGVSEEDARYYNDAVENGHVVVGVPVSQENESDVRDIVEGGYVTRVAAKEEKTEKGETDTANEMVRSEEEVSVDKHNQQVGRVRVVKDVITEDVHLTVPVRKERAKLVTEPIDPNDNSVSNPSLGSKEQEVVLSEEVVDVHKQVVPKERVRLEKEVVHDQRQINEQVQKEQVKVTGSATRG